MVDCKVDEDLHAAEDALKIASLSYSSNESSEAVELSAIPTVSTLEEKKSADDGIVKVPSSLASSTHRGNLSHYTTIDSFVGGVIGPTSLMEVMACPCCQQSLDDTHTSTLNEPAHIARNRGSLLASESEDDDEEEEHHPEDMLPGRLGEGVQYHTRDILVEGWVHKKGTGHDFFGSRSWKPRWARLITARVDGYECPVPLLQIYWHPSAPLPSTVILLESTVVLAVDLEDKERWNAFRFEIRHASTKENVTIPVTRTFTLPRKGRDAWVYAISEALLAYAKEKDSIKKAAVWDALDTDGCIKSPKRDSPPMSPRYDEVWTGDRFVTVEVRKALSPPCSPPASPERRKMGFPSPPISPRLPRPSPKGKSFGGQPTPPRAVAPPTAQADA